ncbi:hypothetical protein PCANC_25646 [Puccinia coronata f. sp. avenae]|uniref:Uncharacterized protein n=1 Tax=Puccinia coronata f. sp. avenae TaxID=200324 RepID=A0A2N5S121_9BASI|nr:hypothetical protein PCANC_25646 [Puccinia coronata f. sp. avenae]
MLASQPEQADGSRRPLWVFEVDQHPALRNKLAALMFVAFTAVLPSTLQESQNRKAATNPECAGESDCAKDRNAPDFVFAYHNRLPGPMVKAPAYDDVRSYRHHAGFQQTRHVKCASHEFVALNGCD